jgi:plastocyanin
MHKRIAFSFLAAVALTPAAAAAPAGVSVNLANFSFAPNVVQLRAGVPTVLHLRNLSSGGHNFSAPAFFAASRIQPQSAAYVRKGRVEVPAGSSVDIALTPAAGQYPLKCSHAFHSAFGMKGTIIVR